jgi:hypothetical protein
MKTPLRFAASTTLNLILGTLCLAQNYTQTNLVSNTPGVARVTDPQLINPSGLSRGSGSAWPQYALQRSGREAVSDCHDPASRSDQQEHTDGVANRHYLQREPDRLPPLPR